tara:strand:- start:220 stop:573 length:354 start_codon:yes stop_codon:yes gene_type:complete
LYKLPDSINSNHQQNEARQQLPAQPNREVSMAHFLPLSSSPLRERFDIASDLAPIGTGERLAPTYADAKASALRTMSKDSGIASVTSICLRANDDLELVDFGPRGRATSLWNFSRGA